MTNIFKYIKTGLLVFMMASLVVITSCKNDLESSWINSGNLSVSQWLESREDMTLLTEALKTTGMYNRMGARGSFTVFAPNNVAMEQLYASNQALKTNVDELRHLLSYHLVVRSFDTEDFNKGGFLNDTTLLGSRITVDFNEPIYVVNGRANIVEQDVLLTNATLHVVDEVLTVPDMSLYQVIAADGDYSIFKSGIDQATSLKEYLSIMDVDSISPSTMIAVPDEVFKAKGVSSLEQLKAFAVAKYAAVGITLEADAALQRYMGYHVLPMGGANTDGYIFMAEMDNSVYQCKTGELDFVTGNFTELGQALLNSRLTGVAETNVPGTELDKLKSNYLHANGVMHVAKTPLEVITTATLDQWGKGVSIVREFETNYYGYFDEITRKYDFGFFKNSGIEYEGLELMGRWYSSSLNEGGPAFVNRSNIPGWFEADLNNVIPGKTYAFLYTGQGFNYSYVFVYLYPVDETDQFLADPYPYKLKDGANEVSIHAEKGVFEYPGMPKNYVYTKKLDKRNYRIRFEVRGQNNFNPGKLVLKPV